MLFSLHWINDLPGALRQVRRTCCDTMTDCSSPVNVSLCAVLSDSPGAEAGWGVHRSDGGRRDALRAALFPAAGRDGAGGRVLAPHLPLHRRHRPGKPAGPSWLQHAHCGESAWLHLLNTQNVLHQLTVTSDPSASLFQDIDDIQVHYPGIMEVMTDLQGTSWEPFV